jgi:hypothetical protein
MRLILLICSLFFIISCSEKPAFHLVDLKQSSANSSEIVLFEDASSRIGSTEPSHNVIPPHGKVEQNRTTWFLGGSCIEIGGYKFCGEDDRIGSRLEISVIRENARIRARPLGGSFYDILYRFIGAPPASVYQIIRFGKDSFGLVHTYGFSVFHSGKFCKPVEINPNGKMSFGTDARGALLIFTSGPVGSVDKAVEGWREYEIAKLCQ